MKRSGTTSVSDRRARRRARPAVARKVVENTHRMAALVRVREERAARERERTADSGAER